MQAYIEIWGRGGARLVPLDGGRVTLGRASTNDVQLADDQQVSRLHAVFERYPAGWSVRDVGSSNGTFVNAERLVAEHRLCNGDEIRAGETRLVFRDRGAEEAEQTLCADDEPPEVTRREHDVLLALCQPMVNGSSFSQPATIREMADELVVTQAAIKFHLSNLYDKFDIAETGGSRRVQLANDAVRRGAVTMAALRRRRPRPERAD